MSNRNSELWHYSIYIKKISSYDEVQLFKFIWTWDKSSVQKEKCNEPGPSATQKGASRAISSFIEIIGAQILEPKNTGGARKNRCEILTILPRVNGLKHETKNQTHTGYPGEALGSGAQKPETCHLGTDKGLQGKSHSYLHLCIKMVKKNPLGDKEREVARGSSVVKCTYWWSRGLGPVPGTTPGTPAPGYLTPTSDFSRQLHMCGTHIHIEEYINKHEWWGWGWQQLRKRLYWSCC